MYDVGHIVMEAVQMHEVQEVVLRVSIRKDLVSEDYDTDDIVALVDGLLSVHLAKETGQGITSEDVQVVEVK